MPVFIFDIGSFIYLIPFILGLSKFPFLSAREKTFFYFATVSAFCSLLAYFTSYVGNNLFVAYIFNAFELLLVPFFLLSNRDMKRYKLVWTLAVFFGFTLIGFEAFFREGGISMFNSYSLTYAAFGLSILCIRNLLKLRFDPSLFDLSKSSIFWFTLGLGIYYLGSILIFAFIRLFQEQDMQVLSNLFYFRAIINIISVVITAWGFVVIKTKNDTLASKS